MNDENDDITIVSTLLDKFRTNSETYRSSMLPLNTLNQKNLASVTKSRKLEFNDFLELPSFEFSSKKQKLDISSKNTVEVSSPWEIRRIKSELAGYRAQLIEAEERIKKSECLKRETELHYLREKNILEANLKEERQKVKDLEEHLNFVRKREAEAIKNYSQLKLEENNAESSILKLLSQLQKENADLKEQLFESQNDINNAKKKEDSYINFLKSELELMKSKDDMNSKLNQELKNDLMEKNQNLRKLEMEQTKLIAATKRINDLESEKHTYVEMQAYVESQNKKLMQFSKIEKELLEVKNENKKLKSSISSTLHLEMVVENQETRLKLIDSLQKEVTDLRTQIENQHIELENWTKLCKHYCMNDDTNLKPFVLVQKKLEELVKKELLYVEESKKLEIKAAHLETKMNDLEEELAKSKDQVNSLKITCESQVSNIKHLERNFALVSWERNNLQNLLDSCQKEMIINSESHNVFNVLQKAIEDYREKTEHMNVDPLSITSGSNIRNSISSAEKDEIKDVSRKEVNQKVSEKMHVINRQSIYQYVKEDTDPRSSKIVGLKTNPTSEAKQNYEEKLTKAYDEIFKLKEKVKLLQEGNSANVSQIAEERLQVNSVKEINDLKERIKSLKIQNQRLIEVFKKRSHDFRDAIYMLFGYKVDFLHNNQYRLCSLYAFDPLDTLLFQVSNVGNGTMELLETSFSQTLPELIDLHLKQHKSIPVFLASLTIDLFNKQTFSCISAMDSTAVVA